MHHIIEMCNKYYVPLPILNDRSASVSSKLLYNKEGLLQACMCITFINAGYKLLMREWSSGYANSYAVGDLVFTKSGSHFVIETKIKMGALTQSLAYVARFINNAPTWGISILRQAPPVFGMSVSLGSAIAYAHPDNPSLDKDLKIKELLLLSMSAVHLFVQLVSLSPKVVYEDCDELFWSHTIPSPTVHKITNSVDDVHDVYHKDFSSVMEAQSEFRPRKVPPDTQKEKQSKKVDSTASFKGIQRRLDKQDMKKEVPSGVIFADPDKVLYTYKSTEPRPKITNDNDFHLFEDYNKPQTDEERRKKDLHDQGVGFFAPPSS